MIDKVRVQKNSPGPFFSPMFVPVKSVYDICLLLYIVCIWF